MDTVNIYSIWGKITVYFLCLYKENNKMSFFREKNFIKEDYAHIDKKALRIYGQVLCAFFTRDLE